MHIDRRNDPPGRGGQNDDAVGQKDRLINGMSDKEDRERTAGDEVEQKLLKFTPPEFLRNAALCCASA